MPYYFLAIKNRKTLYGVKKMGRYTNIFNGGKSHNVYCEDKPNTLKYLSKYLILTQRLDDNHLEIIPTDTITTAIDICKNSNRLCQVFERKGSMGKNWQYLIDMGEMV